MVYDRFKQTEGLNFFFFFFARVVVSFCRNNYHGGASQQRENVAWSHCIFHFQSSSFRVLAFPSDYSVGGKDNHRLWVKARSFTEQAVRSSDTGQKECYPDPVLLASHAHLYTGWSHDRTEITYHSQVNTASLQQQISWHIMTQN